MNTTKTPIAAPDFPTTTIATNSSFGGLIQHDQALVRLSVLQRGLVAILGLSLVLAGPCLFIFNIKNQGWTWVIALIITWLGMSLLLLLWIAGCRYPEFIKTRVEGQSVVTATNLNPLMETLAELCRQTNSRSVVLLSAEGAAWCLRMAWNCSQDYGSNIAHLLEGRVQGETQSLHYLTLMDGTVSSCCTPIQIKSGRPMLLVLISEVNHTMLYDTPFLAFQASMKIVGQLGNATYSVATGGRSGATDSSPRAVCCTVCDSLLTEDGRWIPWGDWLKETYKTTREYTICANCSQWIYGLDASELRAA